MEKININGKEFTVEELNKLIEESKKHKFHRDNISLNISGFNGFCDIEKGLTQGVITFDAKVNVINFYDKAKLMYHMMQFADEHNGDWVADWDNNNQPKWGIKKDDDFIVDSWFRYNPYVFGIAVKSYSIGKAMLDEFKDELDIYLK